MTRNYAKHLALIAFYWLILASVVIIPPMAMVHHICQKGLCQ